MSSANAQKSNAGISSSSGGATKLPCLSSAIDSSQPRAFRGRPAGSNSSNSSNGITTRSAAKAQVPQARQQQQGKPGSGSGPLHPSNVSATTVTTTVVKAPAGGSRSPSASLQGRTSSTKAGGGGGSSLAQGTLSSISASLPSVTGGGRRAATAAPPSVAKASSRKGSGGGGGAVPVVPVSRRSPRPGAGFLLHGRRPTPIICVPLAAPAARRVSEQPAMGAHRSSLTNSSNSSKYTNDNNVKSGSDPSFVFSEMPVVSGARAASSRPIFPKSPPAARGSIGASNGARSLPAAVATHQGDGDVDDGIIAVVTPLGLDAWDSDSSSSSSSPSPPGAGGGGGPSRSIGRFGGIGRSVAGAAAAGGGGTAAHQRRASGLSSCQSPDLSPRDERLTPELVPFGAGPLRCFDDDDDDDDGDMDPGGFDLLHSYNTASNHNHSNALNHGNGNHSSSNGRGPRGSGAGAFSGFSFGSPGGRSSGSDLGTVPPSGGGGGGGGGARRRSSVHFGDDADAGGKGPSSSPAASHGAGLATFFNRPKECDHCQSSAVSYCCETCESYYLCENCRFDEAVLNSHDRGHRISPIHETHCNSSRTFGGGSSMGTMDGGASSLFYDPCLGCGRVIDDAEPVFRCEECDFILCEACYHNEHITHEHELRRFQRRARNSLVPEGSVVNKSRTNDGNKIINDYVIVRLLGQGSYAKVKLVQNIRTRKLFALKILRKTRRSQTNLLNRTRHRQNDDDLLREIAVMKFVEHPNIVKLAEVIDDIEAGKLYVIMEYCASGPVHVMGDPALELATARHYGLEILAGLLNLHSEFLYHRDVKPANCLVDEQDVVKIADFGTCSSRIRSNAADGTPAFTSPEQIRAEEVSGDVADSWAFALTLYQMVYATLPCNNMSAYQYRELLMDPKTPIAVPPREALEMAAAAEEVAEQEQQQQQAQGRSAAAAAAMPPPWHAVRDADLKDLLQCMLDKDLKKRMLLAAAAQHPFFQLDPDGIQRLCRPSISVDDSSAGLIRALVASKVAAAAPPSPVNSSANKGSLVLRVPRASPPQRMPLPAARRKSGSGSTLRLSPARTSGGGGGGSNGSATNAVAAAAAAMVSLTGITVVSSPETSTSALQLNTTQSNANNANAAPGDSVSLSGAASPQQSSRFANLYNKALQEVRRGKNLTEAFYGVKSLRRVRRKDVKNAESATMDNNSSINDDGSGTNTAAGGNSDSGGSGMGSWARLLGSGDDASPLSNTPNKQQQQPPQPPQQRGKQQPPAAALTPKKPAGAPPASSSSASGVRPKPAPSPRNNSTSTNSPSITKQQQLLSPSLSDAAFDLASIQDRVAQQRSSGGATLELTRLHMKPSPPAVVNDTAAVTVNLRFALNSLSSVSTLRFIDYHLLKDVSITSNLLRRFPVEILQAPRLLRLDLSHNGIATIPSSLHGAQFLERLNLHSNCIKSIGVDALSGQSVLAAPSLQHARLTSNPLEALPRALDTTQGIELVLDANPALMNRWYDVVDETTAAGRAPPAVIIWDDYFPARIPGCNYDAWIATGDIALYRAHTLKACVTPFVVLLADSDSRFPAGGAMTAAELTEFLEATGAEPLSSRGSKRLSAPPRGRDAYTLPPPPSRPLPPILSKESRAYVQSYFFASDDVEHPTGGYTALVEFICQVLHRQKTALEELGIAINAADATAETTTTPGSVGHRVGSGGPGMAPAWPIGSSPMRRQRRRSLLAAGAAATTTAEPTASSSGGLWHPEDAEDRPNSGVGLLLMLMSAPAVRSARELAVAALSDALCKMTAGLSDDGLKLHFDAVMEAMRSMYS